MILQWHTCAVCMLNVELICNLQTDNEFEIENYRQNVRDIITKRSSVRDGNEIRVKNNDREIQTHTVPSGIYNII